MRKRVVLLVDRLGSGGAAEVVVNLATNLNELKYDVTVCLSRKRPLNGHDTILNKKGIHWLELDRSGPFDLLAWRPLWRVLPQVDILHSHSTASNHWARIWGKIFNVPIVIQHEHTAQNMKSNLHLTLEKVTGSFATHTVLVSNHDEALRREVSPSLKSPTSVIYNGVIPEKFSDGMDKAEARRMLGLSEDGKIIVCIGRLAAIKNHKNLFDALLQLEPQTRGDLTCLVVGDGPLAEELGQIVAETGLTNTVKFLGFRRDIPLILRAVDFIVLPSDWECLPMVLIEALFAECPIVSTKVGGVPEIIAEAGWPLAQPKSPEALAEAMIHLMEMPDSEVTSRAKSGMEFAVEMFSVEKMSAQVELLYDALIDESEDGK